MTTKKINLAEADDHIVTYLETLLEKKGMGDMPPNILADMLMDLYSRFEKHLFLSAMQNMSEEGYKKFDAFIEKEPTPEKSITYLKKHIPEFDQVIKSSMDEFEQIYLGKKPVSIDLTEA